jgi:hypothetical protein
MMLLAGASRAVVPVPPWPPALPWAADLGARADAAGPAAFASPAVFAAVPDELAALLALPEHPARNIPPPIRTLPIMRPAATPCLVPLAVFRMPL